jgi:glutamine synthetase
MMKICSDVVCEYIWIGGNGELRSKTRVLHNINNNIDSCPEWNYDGSSTEQAPSDGNTEVILKPCSAYKDPFRFIDKYRCYLVLCDTYNNEGQPLPTNHRNSAVKIFNKIEDNVDCWFGLEQEYFIRFNNCFLHPENNGSHYCGFSNKLEKTIVEEHLQACISTGLQISGINAEVATGQWEFQIGPSHDIEAADQLVVARYLLERIAEKYDATIDYSPKLSENANGSGCHINFSTEKMRNEGGLEEILYCMKKLEENHDEHIAVYGKDNHLRLTGLHETSSMDKFTWGIGTRNTSVRIPNLTKKNGCGYFEDRRPAANIDPYLATSIIAQTCCL